MPDEIKPEGEVVTPPAGDVATEPSTPNQGPSAEELLKQKQELENQLKERDAKISDLETTKATIEARQRQLDDAKTRQSADEALAQRIARIEEQKNYDPDGAHREMTSLLSEIKTQAARDAVMQAQSIIVQQTTVEKLKSSIKASNPAFDDDIVEVIMSRANEIAATGKYKTAEEAVKAAESFVKTKLDKYAQLKNAVPPLPAGAVAEGGGANVPQKAPEPPRFKSIEEEIEEANEAKRRRSL